MAAIASEHPETTASTPFARLGAILAALAGAAVGYAIAESLSRAKTSDAFFIAPGMSELSVYAMALALLAAVSVAFEFAAPPLLARGGRAARNLRALIRRRARHGRTRAEIEKVELGLTLSFCTIATIAALAFTPLKVIAVLAAIAAILATLSALASFCRLVGNDPRWSALVGCLYGLGAGYLMT